MDAAEAMFFDGAPLAHVVAFRERQRLARRAAADQDAFRRRQGGR